MVPLDDVFLTAPARAGCEFPGGTGYRNFAEDSTNLAMLGSFRVIRAPVFDPVPCGIRVDGEAASRPPRGCVTSRVLRLFRTSCRAASVRACCYARLLELRVCHRSRCFSMEASKNR